MRHKPLRTWTCLLVLAGTVPADAVSQGSLSADRPGIGAGAFVLPPRALQLEVGAEYATGGGITRYSFGQLLLRVGVADLEVQAALNSFVIQRGPVGDDEGLNDLGLGAKVRLLRRPEAGIEMAVLASVNVPTGAAFLTIDEWLPSATLLADWSVSPTLTLSGNFGYAPGVGAVEEQWTAIVTPAVALPVYDGLGGYAGYAGFYTATGNQHFAEAGLTLAVNPDLQIDINGGVDVESGDVFVGIGLATR